MLARAPAWISSQQLAADRFASRPAGLLRRFLADAKKPERKTAFLECGGIEATMAALTMQHKKQPGQQGDDGGGGSGGSNGSSDASAKLAENACGA